MKYKLPIISLTILTLVSLSSCEKDSGSTADTKSIEVKNMAADIVVSIITLNGKTVITTSKKAVYFRFEDSAKLTTSADSAAGNWDLSFRTGPRGDCVFILNSAKNASGFLYKKAYDEVKEVPKDSTFKKDNGMGSVLSTGWFTYNAATHTIAPTPGITFMINTAKGQKVKMEMLSIYKDAKTPTSPNDVYYNSYFYNFRYTIQKNTSLSTF